MSQKLKLERKKKWQKWAYNKKKKSINLALKFRNLNGEKTWTLKRKMRKLKKDHSNEVKWYLYIKTQQQIFNMIILR